MPESSNDDPSAAESYAGIPTNELSPRIEANLAQIRSKVSARAFHYLGVCLGESWVNLSDPDRAINNLERLVFHSAPAVESLFLDHQDALRDLLVLFATSQSLSDTVIRYASDNPTVSLTDMPAERRKVEWLELGWLKIWQRQGELLSSEQLSNLLWPELESVDSMGQAMEMLRRFKRSQTLRIGVGDLFAERRLDQVASQISHLASTIVDCAYRWLRRRFVAKWGHPVGSSGRDCQYCVLAMGKLGGFELNYSSDIDLLFIFDEPGLVAPAGSHQGRSLPKLTHQEFFARLSQQLVKLVSESTQDGACYRVDLRLRPNGGSGKICRSFDSMMQYYDLQGRTWERQALIKCRPIAGDCELGERLLEQLNPWIYRRNLSRADIGGIKALKRRIERRARDAGEDETNIKTGHGGIRDIEFVIQFLQLLNGGDLPEIRTPNTLEAVRRLEKTKCLSPAESTVLAQNYRWLRGLEHRLQMMFDLQTHSLPTASVELVKIAKTMGLIEGSPASLVMQFQSTLKEVTESNRKILDHLLHGSFGMAFGSMRDTGGAEYRLDREDVPLEVDLILDPDPEMSMIQRALEPYGFENMKSSYQRLIELSQEPTAFLANRRCKHFLASVAPALLAALSQTPDPDQSLVTLATVSECLGAKGVLWELFRFNPPTLSLYVRLCASSDYLVGILKTNPGMIDELLDALQLDGLPTRDRLEANMIELASGATDIVPILHGFKNTQHMRVGIRDILNRDEVRQTQKLLADVAEICLKAVADFQYQRLLRKYAVPDKKQFPLISDCPLVILALGKLGGSEPNYHSDLDVIFLYDSVAIAPQSIGEKGFTDFLQEGITEQFFFSELAAAITQTITHHSQSGRLYEIDSRLRPTGKSGALAVSTNAFIRYFSSGKGQLWERQALCKARPVFGSDANCERVEEMVQRIVLDQTWLPEMADEIRAMRLAMQKDCSARNLKRGNGGTVDVEFAIQMLQLKHAKTNPKILVPGTLKAIEQLELAGFLSSELAERLRTGYRLLRTVEARLRLMNTAARHDFPENKKQMDKLAFLLQYQSAAQLEIVVNEQRHKIREAFDNIFSSNE